jgi:hypothetical protein
MPPRKPFDVDRMLAPLEGAVASTLDVVRRYRKRLEPTGFALAIADQAHMLNPGHWDQVTAQASVFCSRAYLAVLDTHAPAGMRTHHALVYRDGQPVAAVSAQSFAVSANALATPEELASKRDQFAWSTLARAEQRVLVCGNLLSWGPHGVTFAPGVRPEDAWPGVADALYRIRRADRLFGQTDLVLVKDLPHELAGTTATLLPYSYRRFETEPDMRLTLDPAWRSFDDYLGSLRKDYRKAIKTVRKDVEAAGLRVERLDLAGVRAHSTAMHRLYLDVLSRQALAFTTLRPSYLPALAEALGEGFATTAIRSPDGALAGFVTTVRDGGGAVGYYIGYDRALADKGVPVYLRLLQGVVEDALTLGAAHVSFGRTALEPKARLGAVPVPLTGFIRHRIDPLNMLVRRMLSSMPEPAEPPARNPFKAPG